MIQKIPYILLLFMSWEFLYLYTHSWLVFYLSVIFFHLLFSSSIKHVQKKIPQTEQFFPIQESSYKRRYSIALCLPYDMMMIEL